MVCLHVAAGFVEQQLGPTTGVRYHAHITESMSMTIANRTIMTTATAAPTTNTTHTTVSPGYPSL